MTKPIVFFSHSSEDSPILRPLRERVLAKTGGTVEVFLSCDGQSIPLGRNWVSRIEDALRESALMFVFLSPNSVRSQWVLFETGYAYAKGIRVIPLGILGVDLSHIAPPLGLLQGFNVMSADGLDNIIVVLNEQFHHSHRDRFTADEFLQCFASPEIGSHSVLGPHTVRVNKIAIYLDKRRGQLLALDELTTQVEAILSTSELQSQRHGRAYILPGLTIDPQGDREDGAKLTVTIDPSLLGLTLPIVDHLIATVRTGGVRGLEFSIDFEPWIGCLSELYKIAAKTHGSELKLGTEDCFNWRSIEFSIIDAHYRCRDGSVTGNARLSIVAKADSLTALELAAFLDVLFERGILFDEALG